MVLSFREKKPLIPVGMPDLGGVGQRPIWATSLVPIRHEMIFVRDVAERWIVKGMYAHLCAYGTTTTTTTTTTIIIGIIFIHASVLKYVIS